MSTHVSEWIAAYYDGELHGLRLYQVESHLQDCAECRAELEGMKSLSSLLEENPAAPPRIAPDRFVAQVGLRLPPQAPSAGRPALKTRWLVMPLGLLVAWAFFQAILIVSGALLWLVPGFGFDPGVVFVEFVLISIGLTVVLAALLWSWLAGWWVMSRTQMTAPASMDASIRS